ncbi:MAG: Nif3-like dinuclear metal center hexameric protein [Veillonellales bacterium]
MSVKCQVVMDALEKLAPRHLAESWDNVGLLLGSPSQDVHKIMTALDVTEAVVDRAIEDGVDMLVAHHPLIFKAITSIRTDLPLGRLLERLIRAGMAVFAVHTNLDIAADGVNDILARKLQLNAIQPLTVSMTEKLVKFVVYVPFTHSEAVRTAMSQAGAGHIGNYSHCAFQSEGTGTFLPLTGTNPFIGKQGTLERVPEIRLETIMPEKSSNRVIKAVLRAHPYEEVAYDLYPLLNRGTGFGLGRIGELTETVPLNDFALRVKTALDIPFVRVAGQEKQKIKKVAVCGGSGAALIYKAKMAGADVLVTGDVKYHEAQNAQNAGIAVMDAGHFGTERPVISFLAQYLNQWAVQNKWSVDICGDSVCQDVFNVY